MFVFSLELLNSNSIQGKGRNRVSKNPKRKIQCPVCGRSVVNVPPHFNSMHSGTLSRDEWDKLWAETKQRRLDERRAKKTSKLNIEGKSNSKKRCLLWYIIFPEFVFKSFHYNINQTFEFVDSGSSFIIVFNDSLVDIVWLYAIEIVCNFCDSVSMCLLF